jgi:rubrerythrin
MDISAIIFILAVLLLVGIYLSEPFTRKARRSSTTREEHDISSFMAERDRMVNALQELDFDYKLGKIPAEDYPALRTEMLNKGADILRKLDDLQYAATDTNAEDRLEKAIAARRADAAVAVKSEVTDDDIESMLATRRKQRKEKSAGFCPRCGQPVLINDRFCPSCGKSLT